VQAFHLSDAHGHTVPAPVLSLKEKKKTFFFFKVIKASSFAHVSADTLQRVSRGLWVEVDLRFIATLL